MKDLGFNEFGELASGVKSGIADEENTKFAKKSAGQSEMTEIKKS